MGLRCAIHKILSRTLLPFWYQREREWLMLEALTLERKRHKLKESKLESEIQVLTKKVEASSDFIGSSLKDFERDIPSILHQTKWEFGFYDLPAQKGDQENWHFNPSLMTDDRGTVWLATRRIWQDRFAYLNEIVFFELNDNKPINRKVCYLPKNRFSESFEDPRCSFDGKRWWLSCVNFIQNQTQAHQVVGPMDSPGTVTRLYHPIIGKNGASIFSNIGHEKNWLWFFHNGEPHLIYLTNPHTIFRYDWFSGIREKWETSIPEMMWMHGEPRGGSPPVLVDGEYWSFFHSFTPHAWPKRRYHMGALAFESKPPFRVTRMTVLPLLSGSKNDPNDDRFPLTVFPGGALFQNGKWMVVMGVNDLRCAWINIPHDQLKSYCREISVDNSPAKV